MQWRPEQTEKVEIAADTQDLCGECPLWIASEQALYWSDITGRRLHRLITAVSTPELLHTGFEVTGLLAHGSGGFTVVNSNGLWRWDGKDNFQHRTETVDGGPCQLNDCIADSLGRVIAGSQFFDPTGPYPLGKLFIFHLDGSADILDEGLHLSNGLAWSPNGDWLYLADSVARRIYRYAYNLQQGTVANKEVFVQIAPDEGMPDGLTTDAEGYLWSAQWYGGCVVRYDPAGNEERRIRLPVKQVSSVAFGGPALTDLYVTSAAHPEPGPIPPGYEPLGCVGGALYRVPVEIQGRVENVSMCP